MRAVKEPRRHTNDSAVFLLEWGRKGKPTPTDATAPRIDHSRTTSSSLPVAPSSRQDKLPPKPRFPAHFANARQTRSPKQTGKTPPMTHGREVLPAGRFAAGEVRAHGRPNDTKPALRRRNAPRRGKAREGFVSADSGPFRRYTARNGRRGIPRFPLCGREKVLMGAGFRGSAHGSSRFRGRRGGSALPRHRGGRDVDEGSGCEKEGK